MAYEYYNALIDAGMEIIGEDITVIDLTCYEAKLETKRGTLHIYCGTNGTARIDKPNGTYKWVYEKTPAQIAAQIKQIVEFYK
jgi:hypothetical protein